MRYFGGLLKLAVDMYSAKPVSTLIVIGASSVVVRSRALLMPWMMWCAVCTQRRNGELYTCVMPFCASRAPAHPHVLVTTAAHWRKKSPNSRHGSRTCLKGLRGASLGERWVEGVSGSQSPVGCHVVHPLPMTDKPHRPALCTRPVAVPILMRHPYATDTYTFVCSSPLLLWPCVLVAGSHLRRRFFKDLGASWWKSMISHSESGRQEALCLGSGLMDPL